MDTVLSIMVLGAIAVVLGALALWRRGARRQAMLMVVLAVILAANVALLLAPLPDGRTPVEAAH